MSDRMEPNSKVIDLTERTGKPKGRAGKRLAKLLLVVLVLVIVGNFALSMMTCHNYKLVSEQTHTDGVNGAYSAFGNGFVRYTSNGIQYIDRNRNVVWETSYEMKNPVTRSCKGRTLAAADLKGNQIYVFDRDGLLGQITTTMPIQAFSVSEQGVVAAVVRSSEQTKLILYDQVGNVLVEGRTSFAETGYPLAAAISPNGKKVMVSYVSAEDAIKTRLICYNFENVNAADEDRKILDVTYEELLVPELAFVNDKDCYAVGNGKLLFYSGENKMKEVNAVDVEEQILSVISDGEKLGIVTAREDAGDKYAIGIYSTAGRKLKFMNFDDEYNTVYMKDGKIFLLDGTHCMIYSTGGQRVFDGEFDTAVSYMVPVMGIHKFLVAEEGRVEIVRLVK